MVLIERGREGRSTKSPSPHDIPEEGTEIKPWGLLYLVGAPLKHGQTVGGEAGPRRLTFPPPGTGSREPDWAFNPGQVGRGRK